jgi:hypothetical protein
MYFLEWLEIKSDDANIYTVASIFYPGLRRTVQTVLELYLWRFQMAAINLDDTSAAARNLGRSSSEDAGLLRRSWHTMADMLSPFSSTALAALPRNPQGLRERSTRADRIPDNHNYGTINLPPGVRVPKKLATPIKVEGKVWLSAERSMY